MTCTIAFSTRRMEWTPIDSAPQDCSFRLAGSNKRGTGSFCWSVYGRLLSAPLIFIWLRSSSAAGLFSATDSWTHQLNWWPSFTRLTSLHPRTWESGPGSGFFPASHIYPSAVGASFPFVRICWNSASRCLFWCPLLHQYQDRQIIHM